MQKKQQKTNAKNKFSDKCVKNAVASNKCMKILIPIPTDWKQGNPGNCLTPT